MSRVWTTFITILVHADKWCNHPVLTLFVTFVAVAGSLGLFGWVVRDFFGGVGPVPQRMLFLERFGGVTSGYSVLVPTCVIAAGLFGYAAISLRLLRRQENFRVPCPYPEVNGRPTTAARRALHQIRELDENDGVKPEWWWYPLAVGVAAVIYMMVAVRAHGTFEGAAWDWLFRAGFALLAYLTAVGWVRVRVTWMGIRQLLRQVGQVPMVGAFGRLPDKARRRAAQWMLLGRRQTTDLNLLRNLADQIERSPDVPFGAEAAMAGLNNLNHFEDRPAELTAADITPFVAAARELVPLLEPGWRKRDLDTAYGSDAPPKADKGDKGGDEKKPDGKKPEGKQPTGWEDLAEQFVALCVVLFLARHFDRLRQVAGMLAITTGALMLAATSYAFQPEQLILYVLVGVTATVSGLLLVTLYLVNRNDMVSRLSRSTPDRFTPDVTFFTQLSTFVIPLVVLTVAQLTGRLRAVFEPLLDVLR